MWSILAFQSLKQLAVDGVHQNPLALLNNIFIADTTTGADTFKEALTLQDKLWNFLASAGIVLKK